MIPTLKQDSDLCTFPPISEKKQQVLIEKKIEERFNNTLLTDVSNENYAINRKVAYDLCKGDFSNLKNFDPARLLSSGFVFWCDNFVWIQNPRADTAIDKNVPFLLYDYQEKAAEEILRAIVLGYDIPIEKSRDMGLSWLIIAIYVYLWNFNAYDFLLGSGKAEYVDTKGSMKSLFEKARYIISSTPDWLVPKMEAKKDDKSMLLKHPGTGAQLVGESNNVNFGRSDRKKAILFDEFAMWEMTDRAAWQSCSSSTSCRIPLSTANTRGTNCHFFTVVSNAKKKQSPYLRLHWTMHPLFAAGLYYNELGQPRSPWYDEQIKRAPTLAEIRQEIDIDYAASMGDKVFPMFSLEDNVKDGLEYDPHLPLYISADFGLDTTAFVWWQEDKKNGLYYIIDEYQNSGAGDGTSIYHFIEVLQSKEYKMPLMYGDPHSGENRSLTSGQSNAMILRKYGYVFKSQRMSVSARIEAARNIMPKILVSDKCIITIEALSSWQFVRPKTGNTSSKTPQHNEYSHIGDAITYFAGNHLFKNPSSNNNKKRRNYFSSYAGIVG